ncbi:hypothetical protein PVNG_02451 [Plasmodium vivax North Korean]|uniref:RNA polymerase alpha subunit C-terminal domain-containing protein n=1 Tax=Plasmodium vivax North Korean TaxID=1035514 RepID=A0A0J9W6U3_PLAVI|nr:hypothetical protein PVNG_02451 [Plasmodium vivax North Korean]
MFTKISEFKVELYQIDKGKGCEEGSKVSIASSPIETLGFENKNLNLLKRHAINTVSELINYTIEDLQKLQGIGPKAIEDFREKVSKAGYSFRESK